MPVGSKVDAVMWRLFDSALRCWVLSALCLSALLSPERSEAGARLQESGFVPGELLVSFSADATARIVPGLLKLGRTGVAEFDEAASSVGVGRVEPVFRDSVLGRHRSDGSALERVYKLVLAPGNDLFTALETLSRLGQLEYVELNLIYRATLLPSDTEWSEQWALHNEGERGAKPDADIDAPEAWELEQGQPRVLIAIVDTGISHKHADLRGERVLRELGYDFVNDRTRATDDHGHGTYVAGIAGANSNNGRGVAGVCWRCGLIPVKVLNADGEGTAEQVARGIEFAADQGAQIINLSLGYSSGCGCSKTVAAAINHAWESGALLVAASGNDGDREAISYPGASSRVLAVGASDNDDEQSSFSNLDRTVDLLAPGEDIIGLDARKRRGTYREASGTSAASPHVAGVAGLIWSANPDLTNAEVWRTLRTAGDRLSRSLPRRLNAFKSLLKIQKREVRARFDNCDEEPECLPGCGAELVLSPDVNFRVWVQRLRALRQGLLAASPVGLELAQLYELHQAEIARILLSDSELRAGVLSTLRTWRPLLEYALSGVGAGEVSVEQAESAWKSLGSFEARSSEDLGHDLRRVRGYLEHLGVFDPGTPWSILVDRIAGR